jgi:hypothetical protein
MHFHEVRMKTHHSQLLSEIDALILRYQDKHPQFVRELEAFRAAARADHIDQLQVQAGHQAEADQLLDEARSLKRRAWIERCIFVLGKLLDDYF